MVAGWMAFFWAWSLVLRTVTARAVLATVVFIVVSLALNVAVVTLWITHNVGLFARKGPRKGINNLPFNAEHDFLGRTLVGDWDELRNTNQVAVVVQGNHKRFLTNRPSGGLSVVGDPDEIRPAP